MTDNIRGSVFMTLSMVLFAFEDLIFKSLTPNLPTGWTTLIYGLGGMILFSFACLGQNQSPITTDIFKPTLLIRSVFEIAGRLSFALALAYAPLSISVAILQAAPLVVTLGAVLFLGEKARLRHWLAMGVGFIGVLLILRPTPQAFDWTALFALFAMVGFAARDLATRASPPAMSAPQLGVLGFAMLASAGAILMGFDAAPARLPDTGEALRLAILVAVGVAGYSLLTRAMRIGDVAVVTPFRYTRLLVGIILAVVVFHEQPDVWVLLGSGLIVVSGLYAQRKPASEM